MVCLSPEYQICRSNGDVERPGQEKLSKFNTQAIIILQNKEGMLCYIESIYFCIFTSYYINYDS